VIKFYSSFPPLSLYPYSLHPTIPIHHLQNIPVSCSVTLDMFSNSFNTSTVPMKAGDPKAPMLLAARSSRAIAVDPEAPGS
jgi:hypothetical protein